MNPKELNTYGLSIEEVQEVLDAFATEEMALVLDYAYEYLGRTREEFDEDFDATYLEKLSWNAAKNKYGKLSFE